MIDLDSECALIGVKPDSVCTSCAAAYIIMCNARNPCSGAYSIIAGSAGYPSVEQCYNLMDHGECPWSQTGPLIVVEAVEGWLNSD